MLCACCARSPPTGTTCTFPQAFAKQIDTCHSAARPSFILGLGMCFHLRSLMHSWGCRWAPSDTRISGSTSVWVNFAVLSINLPFAVASSRKPAAVQAHSGHRVAKFCVAATWARTAVGKPKIARQTSAAVLTVHLPAAGALPRHLVAQRAQRALRVALACWKNRKQSCVLNVFPPTPLIADTAQRQYEQWRWKIRYLWKHILHCFTHNHGFKALKSWGTHEEPDTGTGAGCQVLTVAATEAEAVAACRAGVTAASHDVGFALTLAPQFTAAGVQRPLGIAFTCCQGERKSKQVWL